MKNVQLQTSICALVQNTLIKCAFINVEIIFPLCRGFEKEQFRLASAMCSCKFLCVLFSFFPYMNNETNITAASREIECIVREDLLRLF